MANFEFKPFDKVLVRNRWSMWIPAFYGMKSESKHLTSAGWQDECIPYEGNEEYLGTSNNYVDKVSKFKVGDWLVENEPNNYARFVQILEIVDIQGKNRYRISRDLHNDEDVAECRFVEKYYHPFNIQDAKDGDVLHSIGCHNDCVFIFYRLDNCKFDEPNGERVVGTGHCCLTLSADNMEFGIQGPDCIEVTIKPATKIQRDLLKKAMADAGYTFDFDKKELKKIEQKPTWSEKYIADVFEKVGLAKIVREQSNDNLTNALQDAMIGLSKFIPQPKQEWSEEDEKMIENIIDTINMSIEDCDVDDIGTKARFSLEKERDWLKNKLKSLRPQNHWKPSDGQIKVCKEIYADLLSAKGFDLGTVNSELNRLEEELKKLKG